MTERPIIFSAPMVRALLDGTKTQTRRICKASVDDGGEYRDIDGWPLRYDEGTNSDILCGCLYGAPGDRLWVRETWLEADRPRRADGRGIIVYRAAYPDGQAPQTRWRSPIHMARRDSRITLEVTGVRVERLHTISEDDCMAEGIATRNHCVSQYWNLWESINGAGSWESNPWVWVISFRRVP